MLMLGASSCCPVEESGRDTKKWGQSWWHHLRSNGIEVVPDRSDRWRPSLRLTWVSCCFWHRCAAPNSANRSIASYSIQDPKKWLSANIQSWCIQNIRKYPQSFLGFKKRQAGHSHGDAWLVPSGRWTWWSVNIYHFVGWHRRLFESVETSWNPDLCCVKLHSSVHVTSHHVKSQCDLWISSIFGNVPRSRQVISPPNKKWMMAKEVSRVPPIFLLEMGGGRQHDSVLSDLNTHIDWIWLDLVGLD